MPRRLPPADTPLAKPVDSMPVGTLRELKTLAADCRACPLWRKATQTVFGEGRARAKIMLIGEQPGSQEDIQGRPFVGPAGRLLDKAMEEAGLARNAVYLTNTVKHFKFEQRGKARLHQRANATEQTACRPWLAAELARVRPERVVALGLMAAQTLFGNAFRMGRDRGQWHTLKHGVQGLATWHPSAILRLRRAEERDRAFAELVADLKCTVRREDRH
ncbi:MAG TPA: UdgX family uracil-DNA binding protein [Dyella sp.]|uniref:UdgX family uracil-DNA binding protein n=1 Tax=Dyella sp. TaxID=1869338 RepID=UPI002F93C3D1